MRTSALTDVGNGWWEVELFGPLDVGCGKCAECEAYLATRAFYEVDLAEADCPNSRRMNGHHYRRHVQSIELATAMIQWWHSDYPVAPPEITNGVGL